MQIWIDDGWALPRDAKTQKPTVDPNLFPSGMRNLSDYVHAKGLQLGIYTSKGPLTCLGGVPGQPKRPGSCGYEELDAQTYAHDWQVDQVKDDGWCAPSHRRRHHCSPTPDPASAAQRELPPARAIHCNARRFEPHRKAYFLRDTLRWEAMGSRLRFKWHCGEHVANRR